jgi:hypothetical protein
LEGFELNWIFIVICRKDGFIESFNRKFYEN